MKIYTASAWGKRDKVRAIAHELETLGVTITSRWLNEPVKPEGASLQKWRRETALVDIEDVRAADVLVRFSDADDMDFPLADAKLVSGARMFEMGYAYASGKPIVVVGGVQNVFDYLPNVIHLPDVEALKAYLSLWDTPVQEEILWGV